MKLAYTRLSGKHPENNEPINLIIIPNGGDHGQHIVFVNYAGLPGENIKTWQGCIANSAKAIFTRWTKKYQAG